MDVFLDVLTVPRLDWLENRITFGLLLLLARVPPPSALRGVLLLIQLLSLERILRIDDVLASTTGNELNSLFITTR